MKQIKLGSKEFKTLQAKWYQKLKDKGFKDIEHPTRDLLTDYHAYHFKAEYSPEQYEEKARYFQLAGQLLHDHVFLTARDKKIWALYCEGLTFRDIGKKVKVSKDTVCNVVNYYAKYIKT